MSRARVGAWLWLVVFALATAACRPAVEPQFGSGLARVPATPDIRARERAMFQRLNRDRAEQGLPPLRFDERLSDIARHHSQDMRDNHFFEHDSPRTGGVESRLDAAGYSFLSARENLSEAPDVESGQEGLLNSPPHYRNIMASDVTHVGIGIVRGGEAPQNLTITQVFARPFEPQAPEQARREILARVKRERRAAGVSPARSDARLEELAASQIQSLDEAGSPESVERAGAAVAAQLAGKQSARLSLSAQVVPTAELFSLPQPLAAAPTCSFGLAVRRVKSDKGRPGLQVLLITTTPAR